ncbi:MAG: M1 family aminopeptidase [Bacteroidia bacterium]
MKYAYFPLLLCLAFAFPASAQLDSSLWEHYRIKTEGFEQRAAFKKTPEQDNFDVLYYRLAVEIDPAVKFIQGAVTVFYQYEASNGSPIILNFSDSLVCDSVYYNGSPMPFFSAADDLLTIDITPRPLPFPGKDSLTIYYHGIPPTTGHGSFVQDFHGQSHIIWTLSEPYGAKDWWPCKQTLDDKADSIDIIVTTPMDYRAASNGLLTWEDSVNGRMVYHWKHRYPIATYLVAIAVTDYVFYSDYVPLDNGDSLEVLNYIYPEFYPEYKVNTARLIPIMQLFIELFGDYPFEKEKYGHAQFGWGGGMEHQTMSFMQNFSYELMAHELAHQWFGDKVTCGSWHDLWLNEGFATYASGLCYERGMGDRNWHDWKQLMIDNITGSWHGSVYKYDTTFIWQLFDGRTTYNKGAMVLHMLRWVVGDEAFFDGIRNYLEDPELAYGFAITEDLRQHLEATSDTSLTEFFEDWIYGQGHPIYSVEWIQKREAVELTIRQRSSAWMVPFFEMPVPIQFAGKGRDTTVVFQHTYSGQQFSANIGFPVDSIIFDPDLWIVTDSTEITRLTDETLSPFRIYPNPAENVLQLDYQPQTLQPVRIEIFDSRGKQVLTGQYEVSELNPRFFTFGIQNLSPGLYIVRLQAGEEFYEQKLMKHSAR